MTAIEFVGTALVPGDPTRYIDALMVNGRPKTILMVRVKEADPEKDVPALFKQEAIYSGNMVEALKDEYAKT